MEQEELTISQELSDELDRLSEGQFMQPEITDKQEWLQLDEDGITYLYPTLNMTIEAVALEYDCNLEDCEVICIISGYGARLQAPGYLDATEWMVFDTPDEAAQQLIQYYGDESFNPED